MKNRKDFVMIPPTSYKKAVILGAAGFIGINLSHALAQKGYKLICFDQVTTPHWPQKATPITGDFATLSAELLQELDHALVFHLISSSRPSPFTIGAADEVSRDLVTTIRYLEETRIRNLRWVFLSSGGTVYGQNNGKTITESEPTNPICSYGVVKLAIEKYFALYQKLHGIDYVTVRLSNPYGPWQHPLRGQGVISTMLYKALRNELIEIWGDGSNVRDYIYITDAVHGVLNAAMIGKSGETYNIGTAFGLSINQLIEIMKKTLNIKPVVRYCAARSVDVNRNVLNFMKISAHTGWKPETSIDEGMAMTASWLNQNFEFFK
ncbi:hypothetical protein B2D07_03555 [Desulfococcus multivorans]|nr:NAD-dependent epimerase/dehydratase family protein [Desulfococcus multivorans]AQU99943.2 hypothetical protein B2D07_03555 [Desulfococcus multivorans]